MKTLTPYLNFDGDAEEAFRFYASVFGGEPQLLRFKDLGMGNGEAGERAAHIALPLGDGMMLMASDTSPTHSPKLVRGNDVYVMLEPESAEEAQRIFDALAAGGKVGMDLQSTEWAQKHGSCTDMYGVQWMINYTGDVQFSPDS